MLHAHRTIDNESNGLMYDVDIFQSSYNEIVISLKNRLYHDPSSVQFVFRVREKEGIAWQVNKSSLSNDSGKAADLVEFFATWPGENYIRATVHKLIFNNAKKRCTPGL